MARLSTNKGVTKDKIAVAICDWGGGYGTADDNANTAFQPSPLMPGSGALMA
jgi:hypothetical protein